MLQFVLDGFVDKDVDGLPVVATNAATRESECNSDDIRSVNGTAPSSLVLSIMIRFA